MSLSRHEIGKIRPLLWLILGVMLFFVVACGIGWLAHIQKVRKADTCAMNIELIQSAKMEWAKENDASSNMVAAWSSLQVYGLATGGLSTNQCPSGGSYDMHMVSEYPTCTRHGLLLCVYTLASAERYLGLQDASVEVLDGSGTAANLRCDAQGYAFVPPAVLSSKPLMVVVRMRGFSAYSNSLDVLRKDPHIEMKRATP